MILIQNDWRRWFLFRFVTFVSRIDDELTDRAEQCARDVNATTHKQQLNRSEQRGARTTDRPRYDRATRPCTDTTPSRLTACFHIIFRSQAYVHNSSRLKSLLSALLDANINIVIRRYLREKKKKQRFGANTHNSRTAASNGKPNMSNTLIAAVVFYNVFLRHFHQYSINRKRKKMHDTQITA